MQRHVRLDLAPGEISIAEILCAQKNRAVRAHGEAPGEVGIDVRRVFVVAISPTHARRGTPGSGR
jgi:hypothetical protein